MDNLLHNSIDTFYNLYTTMHIYRRRIAENPMDLANETRGMQRMLEVMNGQKNCSLKRLCNILGISLSAGSLMIDKAVKKGYIDRKPGEKDRRKVVLSLTPEGKAIAEYYHKEYRKYLKDNFKKLSDEDLDKIIKYGTELKNILEKIELIPEE